MVSTARRLGGTLFTLRSERDKNAVLHKKKGHFQEVRLFKTFPQDFKIS
jgi:hypothetical protein